MLLKKLAVAAITIVGFSVSANAAIIAATDFDGRTIAPGSDTASNLIWTTTGIDAITDLSADAPLFDTGATQDLFAVDQNIQTEGPWSTSIALNVLGQVINLESLDFNAFIFSNSGIAQNVQTASRDLDFVATIFDSGMGVVAQQSVFDVFPSTGPYTPGALVSFDFSSVSLMANSMYTLSLTAQSDDVLGNNAGIDNFQLTGSLVAVSAPASLSIFALFFGALVWSRKRFN